MSMSNIWQSLCEKSLWSNVWAMKGQMWGLNTVQTCFTTHEHRTHSIYGFGLCSGWTSVCLLCLHWNMICGFSMFRRKWFSWFLDTAKTADGFGFAHGASRTSVLDNSVGHCDRQWQMVRSCSLGDICTDRDYTLAGGLCAHTHTHARLQTFSVDESLTTFTCWMLCRSIFQMKKYRT